MIATGGFGAFSDNPVTQSFQIVFSENISADFLQPFNSYMENISAPTIQPGSDSTSEPAFDLIGTLASADDPTTASMPTISLDGINTSIAELSASMTLLAADTATAIATLNTATLLPTATFLPTLTSLPSPMPTLTLVPSLTLVPVFIPPSRTPRPPDPDTATPVPTQTAIPTPTAASTQLFNYSAVNINGMGTSAIVLAGQPFLVAYNFNIWDDPCPGCISQLVTGLGTAGSHGSTCAFDGGAGLFPGTSGSENVTLTAPANPGTYDVVVVSNWQFTCTDALNAYPSGGTPQIIGQIIVQ